MFISYAQNFEDVILWRALQNVENGFYVDVGAADPQELSVTRAFYERGWCGVNIEPLDGHFDKLQAERTRDTNLKVVAASQAGLRTFYGFDGTGLSTFDTEIAIKHVNDRFCVSPFVTPAKTLNEILEPWKGRPIHFLKIDVEGGEAEVLGGLDLEQFRPWIILVEATAPLTNVVTKAKWEHLITNHNYHIAYFDGVNCFYVADEVGHLTESISVPPNVLDAFISSREFEKDREIERLKGQLNEAQTRASLEVSEIRKRLETEKKMLDDMEQMLGAVRMSIHKQLVRTEEPPGSERLMDWIRSARELTQGLRSFGNRLTGGGIRALLGRLFGPSPVARIRKQQQKILDFPVLTPGNEQALETHEGGTDRPSPVMAAGGALPAIDVCSSPEPQ
jgi:FkbM family methyltransferase